MLVLRSRWCDNVVTLRLDPWLSSCTVMGLWCIPGRIPKDNLEKHHALHLDDLLKGISAIVQARVVVGADAFRGGLGPRVFGRARANVLARKHRYHCKAGGDSGTVVALE